jgi:hypothetical protein
MPNATIKPLLTSNLDIVQTAQLRSRANPMPMNYIILGQAAGQMKASIKNSR